MLPQLSLTVLLCIIFTLADTIGMPTPSASAAPIALFSLVTPARGDLASPVALAASASVPVNVSCVGVSDKYRFFIDKGDTIDQSKVDQLYKWHDTSQGACWYRKGCRNVVTVNSNHDLLSKTKRRCSVCTLYAHNLCRDLKPALAHIGISKETHISAVEAINDDCRAQQVHATKTKVEGLLLNQMSLEDCSEKVRAELRVLREESVKWHFILL
jgi:hypothetical protein